MHSYQLCIIKALIGVISSVAKRSREIFLNRFLHFGPLCGPSVEMTKAQIITTIGIIPNIIIYNPVIPEFSEQSRQRLRLTCSRTKTGIRLIAEMLLWLQQKTSCSSVSSERAT